MLPALPTDPKLPELGATQGILFHMSAPSSNINMAPAKNLAHVEKLDVKSADFVDPDATPKAKVTAPVTSDDDTPRPTSKNGPTDPFVVKEQKLSATAAAFTPSKNKEPLMRWNISARIVAPAPNKELAAMLKKQIVTAEKAAQPFAGPRSMSGGVFSYDTDGLDVRRRCMKVTAVSPGTDIKAVLSQTLAELSKAYQLGGDIEPVETKDALFLHAERLTDAEKVYWAISTEQPLLDVRYVDPNVFGAVCVPSREISLQEGAVLVMVDYPSEELGIKATFENDLRDWLGQIGKIHAWKLNTFDEADVCQIIIEYDLGKDAYKAVEQLNGKEAELGPHYPKMKVELYPETLQLPLAVLCKRGRARTSARATQSAADAAFTENLRRLAVDTPMGTPGYYNNQAHHPSFHSRTPPTPGDFMPIYSTGSPTMNRHHARHVGGPMQYHGRGLMSPVYGGTPYSSNGNGPGGYRSYEMGPAPYMGTPYPRSNGYDPRGNGYDRPFPSSGPRNGISTPYRRRGGLGHMYSIHNSVEPEKIVHGGDVRTTVMLRNIPNKVSQHELQGYLNVTSLGKYDFSYLRIDFSNNCNVGYAFINFADPLDIIPFFIHRAGRRWDGLDSNKILEISYATIQGRDCLIQKFRNSSVMAEAPHCRPKLWYTDGDGAQRAGQEEVFPAPDNIAKLKRSCANAEHIGLYAPTVGSAHRDDQRRRTSQYDRGTTMAEMDDQALTALAAERHRPDYVPRNFM